MLNPKQRLDIKQLLNHIQITEGWFKTSGDELLIDLLIAHCKLLFELVKQNESLTDEF